ncbi:hypothetical protein CHARACLAT_014876 [Characodon lateralis]|uniref:Secreted protein n=1 Tax=Characodon lateralis TaxID=208331 RepID=A0ABU7ELW4_9TELE|nr:hypothetical protein [Characodon lateralis]
MVRSCLTLSSFCPLSYPLLLKCKESVSQSLSSFTHSHYLSHLSLSLSLTVSLLLSVSVSVCPGMIKDSFVTPCEASRKQRTSNRNSQKDMHSRNRGTCVKCV